MTGHIYTQLSPVQESAQDRIFVQTISPLGAGYDIKHQPHSGPNGCFDLLALGGVLVSTVPGLGGGGILHGLGPHGPAKLLSQLLHLELLQHRCVSGHPLLPLHWSPLCVSQSTIL